MQTMHLPGPSSDSVHYAQFIFHIVFGVFALKSNSVSLAVNTRSSLPMGSTRTMPWIQVQLYTFKVFMVFLRGKQLYFAMTWHGMAWHGLVWHGLPHLPDVAGPLRAAPVGAALPPEVRGQAWHSSTQYGIKVKEKHTTGFLTDVFVHKELDTLFSYAVLFVLSL